MKISCTRENLLAGLSLVSRVASKNLTLPILGNVLLRAHNNFLTLSATNLEVGVVSRVRGKVAEDGSITVQARLINDFVNLLEHDRIELESEGTSLRVLGKSSRTTIRGMPADDFPIIPEVSREWGFQVSSGTLREALGQVLFAAAHDSARPEISGIFAHVSGDRLTLAATDSYRLAERSLEIKGAPGERATIMPSRALFELLKILPTEETTEVFVSESQALFVAKHTELTTRLIEGQYPDYKQIVPASMTTEATLEVEPLVKLVKTASLFCKPGINDITIELSPDRSTVGCRTANSELGEHEGTIAAPVKGKPSTIVFNFHYLLDGLSNIGASTVTLGVNDSASPGVLRPKGGEHYLYLIMPIRQ